jgi:sugar phosphate isomerase/epimerase
MLRISAYPGGFSGDIAEGRMTLFKWIDLAGQLGVDGLELSPRFLASMDSSALRRVRQEAAARSLRVSMMRDEAGLAGTDPAEEVRRLRKLLQLTAELGGRACRIPAGLDLPGVDPGESRRRAVDGLHELLPYAESTSVTLLLGNQDRDRFLAVLDGVQSPWLKAGLEAAEGGPAEFLDRVLPRLGAVHGAAGADALWSRLAGAGFDGWAVVEGGGGGSVNDVVERLRGEVKALRAALARHFTGGKP